MEQEEYDSLALRVSSKAFDNHKGELTAGKLVDATYLEIGGDAEVTVQETEDKYTIHFEAGDSTRGELTVPKEAFR